MLAKKNRINKKLFKEVFEKGKNYHSDLLGIKILKKDEEENQFAFAVSKKIAPKASQRNLLKRRGYEIIRELFPNIKQPIICIFVLKKGAEKLSFDKYKKEIEKILRKTKII